MTSSSPSPASMPVASASEPATAFELATVVSGPKVALAKAAETWTTWVLASAVVSSVPSVTIVSSPAPPSMPLARARVQVRESAADAA